MPCAVCLLGCALLLPAGALVPATGPAAARRAFPRDGTAVADAVGDEAALFDAVGAAWELAPDTAAFDVMLEHESPPVLRVREFLSPAERTLVLVFLKK